MHFHFFAPPPPHLAPFLVVAALALTAMALTLSRRRVALGLGSIMQKVGGDRQSHSGVSAKAAKPGSALDNAAFTEYREQTLAQLEVEAREFGVFLERLRRAADAKDFDDFLKERRGGAETLPLVRP